MMMKNYTIGLSLAGALALSAAIPASAAPIFSNPTGLTSAVSDNVTDVRWRGRGVGPGIGLGIAAGALVGAAVAGSAYGPNYYYAEPGYGYGAPVYAQPYGYDEGYVAVEPAPSYGYYGNGYRPGRCFTDEGYGRRRPCSANQ